MISSVCVWGTEYIVDLMGVFLVFFLYDCDF